MASFGPQRTADCASCSNAVPVTRLPALQHRLTSQHTLTRQQLQHGTRCRRRRWHIAMQAVTAQLAAQAAVAEAVSPIVEQGVGGILPAVSGLLRSAISGLIGVSPQWLHPLEIVLGSDIVTLAELQPSANSALRLAVRGAACMKCMPLSVLRCVDVLMTCATRHTAALRGGNSLLSSQLHAGS